MTKPKKADSDNKGGRPPINGERFDDRLLFECMSDDKRRWKTKAMREDVSLGEKIRQLLNEWAPPKK